MSSSEDLDLKAGHPPAVKAGGMRITQHKPPGHVDVPKVETTKEDDEEFPPPSSPPKHQLIISGAHVKGDADFPAEAVKAFHDKPVPAHEKRPMGKPHMIQQPRK